MWQLRSALEDRAPTATWYSSDEPKAVATAHLLTAGQVQEWPALREAHRFDWFASHEEFRAAVLDAFSQPSRSARPGWEPLDYTRRRISDAVGQIVDENGDDVVLVGHGTAWTLLLSELTGTEPDLTDRHPNDADAPTNRERVYRGRRRRPQADRQTGAS